jgi:hypothetical protein
MFGKSILGVLLGICLVSPAVAEKKRDWQVGRITFVETRFRLPDPPIGPVGVNAPYAPNAVVRYTIAGVGKIYVLEMPKPQKTTITGNRTVRFALEQDKAFLIDDKGDEKQLNVLSVNP